MTAFYPRFELRGMTLIFPLTEPLVRSPARPRRLELPPIPSDADFAYLLPGGTSPLRCLSSRSQIAVENVFPH